MFRFPSNFYSPSRSLRALIALLICPIVSGATVRSNDVANNAKNLARMNCGAQIECTTPDGRVARVSRALSHTSDAAALIMEDDTLSCPLQEGETNFVIALPKTALLDRFTFLNENAAARGDLRIAVSNYRLPSNSSKWTSVEGSIPFSHKRLFDLSLLGIEAKFVKLSFRVEKEGRIAALGLYGAQSLHDFGDRQGHITLASNTLQTNRLEDMINFNFANLYARAKVAYVSSGSEPSARRMIDDDAFTAFHFADSDSRPTAIVELASKERLHRVSAVYKMQSGQLDIYLLDELLGDKGNLNDVKPIASIADPGNGKASVNFDPQGARFVALRWTPGTAGQHSANDFEIAEVSAFGNVPLAMLNTDAAPVLYASTSNRPPNPGGSLPPIDPPVIINVSP